jgi:sortase A
MTAIEERPRLVVFTAPRASSREAVALSATRRYVVATSSVLAVIALFAVAFGLGLSRLQEQAAQQRLYAQFRQQLAEGTAPVGPVAAGKPVAILAIPRLHLRNVVVEGTSGSALRLGPGHLRSTVQPGEPGVSVLLGRSVTYGGPFARLGDLRPGDHVTVVSGAGRFDYAVDDVRHPGDRVPAPPVAGKGRLVLGSLTGAAAASVWVPDGSVYVDATTTSRVAAGATIVSPPIVALSPAERMGAGDSGGLAMVVLWLQLLVFAAVGFVWALLRWGRWQAWLTGVPILGALLWAVCNAAMPLLPNTF